MPLDHRDKRALYLGVVACTLIIGAFFGYHKFIELNDKTGLGSCENRNGEKMNCLVCSKIGKIFQNAWVPSCEMKARDAGKRCVFDNECDKGICIHQNENAVQGTCDDYTHDNYRYCHRPQPLNNAVCQVIFS